MSGKTFKILAIDGGGIRGVFPAHILSCLSKRLQINPSNQFNMIAGTSTGAIIAAAIACGIDPEKVIELYRNHGSKIFSRKNSWWKLTKWTRRWEPAFQSLYESSVLEKILKDIFGDVKLGQITKPLLLPATDLGNGGVHVFKSGYSSEFTRDNDVPVHKAVLASCSAPTYFDPSKVKEYLLADGGLWANNPSLAAVIDAQRRLEIEQKNIRILSVGTGHGKVCYGVSTKGNWGLVNGWKGKEFIGFLMSLQAQTTHNYLQLLLKSDQWLRLDFESDHQLPLDDCSSIDDLVSRADKIFTHKSQEIKTFLTVE